MSTGYNAPEILSKVLAAAKAVRDGKRAFERDSVAFPNPECDLPLLAALEHVALARGGNMRVLDFGGSLGSTWFQLRPFLPPVAELAWDVVEQPDFVRAGQQHLTSGMLHFFPTIAAARDAHEHDVCLLSTVVQYLEKPHEFIDEILRESFPFLLLNNLPLQAQLQDRVTVQHVPPEIYPASYPVWFFERERFLSHFAANHRVVLEFASSAEWSVEGESFPSTGILLERTEERSQS
jgi:putative methyltransferase (TIGR04325 family)